MSTKARQAREAEITTGNSELPEGWARARIAELFECWGGMTPSTTNHTYWGGNIPWISSKDIKSQRIKGGVDFITQKALTENRLRLCPIGSVITVVRSGILANTFPVAVAEAQVTINQDLKAFWSSKPTLNEWLAVSLRALESQILDENHKDGTTVHSIRVEQLKNVFLRVPPVSEQSRISDKLRQIERLVAPFTTRLAKLPALLSHFRRSVLAAACSGKLTEDWREANPSIASGRKLFRELRRTKSARGSNELQLVDGWTEIPESWAWISFGSLIGELKNGISTKPNIHPPGQPILRISAVRGGKVDISDRRFLRAAGNCDGYKLRDHDLLFTRYNGSLDLLGVCGMVRSLGDELLLYPDKLMRVRFDHELVLPSYAEAFFSSPGARECVTDGAVSSAGQQGISGAKIKGQPFALPPVEEQQEIVRRVEALFNLADAIEKRIAAATARAEHLTQAILAKAFRGELVPTEAELARREGREYEPASMLLDRIKAEREGNQSAEARPTKVRGARR